VLGIKQGSTNPGRQEARPTTLRMLAPTNWRSSTWNLLHVNLLVPKLQSGPTQICEKFVDPS